MSLVSADSGNILVRNYGRNPAVNFNFMLRVEGLFDLPCKSVRAFQKENEYELIQEGGLNDYVHMRRKPVSKPFTFQVERYVGVDILDPLANGTDLTLPLILMVNRYLAYGDFQPVRCYVFTGCTVMAKEYGELNAEKSGLMVETTTIAYREMFCIDNPASSFLSQEPWGFDGTKKKGNGVQSARHPEGDKEPVKEDWKKKAKKWEFDGKNFTGTGGSTTDNEYAKAEVRRAAMEKKAKEWDFDGTKKEGKGVQSAAKLKVTVTDESGKAVMQNQELSKAVMETKAKKWDIDKPAENQSAVYGKELDKEAMEKKAQKWEFDGKNFTGTGGSTTDNEYAKSEMRKAAMEKKAKEWDFDGTKKEGNKVQSAAKLKVTVTDESGEAVMQDQELGKEAMKAKAKLWDIDKPAENRSAVYGKEPNKKAMEEKAQKWEFDEKSFTGTNGSTTGNEYAKAEMRKSDMEKKAKEWEFDGKSFTGTNGSTTDNEYAKSEVRKAAMEKNAKEWDFDGTKKEGNGVQSAAKLKVTVTNESGEAVMQDQEPGKEAMETRAKQWDIDKPAENRSAVYGKEPDKKAMEKKATKWPPKRSAVDVATFLGKK